MLETEEWQLLYRIEHRTTTAPKTAPTAAEALLWIAKLGGYLNRKSDPEPGVISLWRGWEQLSEMVDNYRAICGKAKHQPPPSVAWVSGDRACEAYTGRV